jgi:hypothetical protein
MENKAAVMNTIIAGGVAKPVILRNVHEISSPSVAIKR